VIRLRAGLIAGLALVGLPRPNAQPAPYLVVLGIAQDGGVPQAGGPDRGIRRHVVSLAVVDPGSGRRWLFEATPDFREQLRSLDSIAPHVGGAPGLDGVFLTHAHIGHYTGLMFLGHESIGADHVPVYAMPRMANFLRKNGPWGQLVTKGNIVLRELADGRGVPLGEGLAVVPFLVPHRQEYSEVVGYRIEGPHRTVLFVPDIDRWEDWDSAGTRLEEVLSGVDVAYVDGTFFANGEVGGRDMSTFPHPFIRTTMARLARLPSDQRAKVRFIHLNHTNPTLDAGSDAAREVRAAGYRVAEEGERVPL